MNKDAFIRDLLMLSDDGADIDGCDLQELMIKHGFLITRPLTREEAEEDWAQQWDCEEGDNWHFYSDELKQLLGREDDGYPA